MTKIKDIEKMCVNKAQRGPPGSGKLIMIIYN